MKLTLIEIEIPILPMLHLRSSSSSYNDKITHIKNFTVLQIIFKKGDLLISYIHYIFVQNYFKNVSFILSMHLVNYRLSILAKFVSKIFFLSTMLNWNVYKTSLMNAVLYFDWHFTKSNTCVERYFFTKLPEDRGWNCWRFFFVLG